MALTLTTAPAVEPVTLAEAKAHCRVDLTDDDTLLDALITAARERAEMVTARALITQTWTLTLDAWPGGSGTPILLERPPVQTPVDHIKYLDTAGAETTWDAANYILDVAAEPARIVPAYSKTWPTATLYPIGGVRVQFKAGYGAAATDVPMAIRQAVLLLIGLWYENREEAATQQFSGSLLEIPLGARALLGPYRMNLV